MGSMIEGMVMWAYARHALTKTVVLRVWLPLTIALVKIGLGVKNLDGQLTLMI